MLPSDPISTVPTFAAAQLRNLGVHYDRIIFVCSLTLNFYVRVFEKMLIRKSELWGLFINSETRTVLLLTTSLLKNAMQIISSAMPTKKYQAKLICPQFKSVPLLPILAINFREPAISFGRII